MEGDNRRPIASNTPPNWLKKKPDIPTEECPVCFEMLLPPIVLCVQGHSICKSCKDQLYEKICPVCRAPMTDKRNELMEKHILELRMLCPNENCRYRRKAEYMEDHLKECLYRDFNCAIGAEFKNCLWSGKLSEMEAHFKEKHKENCAIEPHTVHKLKNFITHRDNKVINLISVKNRLYIFTIKVDTRRGIAYWLIQFIGLAKNAKNWLYDVNIFDTEDNDRNNRYTEFCQSDTITCDDIFATGKCVCMTLTNMETYISNNTLTYSFNVRPIPGVPRNNFGTPHNAGPRNNFGPNNNAGPSNNLGQKRSGLHNEPGPNNST